MVRYIKKSAQKEHQESSDKRVRHTVEAILADIAARGDSAVHELSEKIRSLQSAALSIECRGDTALCIAGERAADGRYHLCPRSDKEVCRTPKKRLKDIEVETLPGVILGHKNIAVNSVGCYVPGGTHPFIGACFMSILTAKVAGVGRIVACAPPQQGEPHPGGDRRHASLRRRRDIPVGRRTGDRRNGAGDRGDRRSRYDCRAGNAYVAEAKRQLFGRVGIDLLAGPTETLLIVDETVDAELCATDLLGQAEHGPSSPAILITNSETLARDTIAEVERILNILPTADVATLAWRDYGEVILCDSYEEMLAQAERIASEHVQVMTARDDWFAERMTAYGALFLGPRTNVAYGDKVIGTNHTLPTRTAARYTGGLWVGKFIKTHTYQKITTDEASAHIGAYCSRLCHLEGFVGHAEQANIPPAPLRQPRDTLWHAGSVSTPPWRPPSPMLADIFNLEHKTALVTGATGVIGKACAHALAAFGGQGGAGRQERRQIGAGNRRYPGRPTRPIAPRRICDCRFRRPHAPRGDVCRSCRCRCAAE